MFAIRAVRTIRVVPGSRKSSTPRTKSAKGTPGGKRSEWVDYSGETGGATYDIAVFAHPSNTRFPTFWHVRDYGLLAANIFGLHDFLNDTSSDGSLTIRPGQPLRFRYRIVIHPGEAAQAPSRGCKPEPSKIPPPGNFPVFDG